MFTQLPKRIPDMSIVQGFMTITPLVSNTPGVVAPFGELSAKARTYSREVGLYVNETQAPDVLLNTFKAEDASGASIVLSNAVRDAILQLGQWVYGQYAAGSIPTNTSLNSWLTAVRTQFPNLSAVSAGSLISAGPSNKNLPDYLAFTIVVSGISYQCTVWFRDASFRVQYTGSEISIIPPTQNIDLLHGSAATVQTAINQSNVSWVVGRVNQISGESPCTSIVPITLEWNDPLGSGATLQTTWIAVIYGSAVGNDDQIRAAIQSYLGQNSTYTEWAKVYPSLYTTNDFTIVPMWDDAFPGNNPGVFVSLSNLGSMISRTQTRVPPSYGSGTALSTHINTNLMALSTNYRAMLLTGIGNPSNAAGQVKLSHIIPDYLGVPASSIDFARMSQDTQQFVFNLENALQEAYTYQRNDPVPAGLSKVVYFDRVYLSFMFKTYRIMVLVKSTY